MKSKIFPIYVEFYDHASRSEWMSKEDLSNFNPPIVYQVGWLVDESEDCIRISGQVTEDGDVGDTITIIKKAIIVKKLIKTKVIKGVSRADKR